jgi:uncharacterized protein YraI
MRRGLIWIIFFLCFILSATVIQAQGGLLTTITQTVKLRAGPGVEWKLMGTLTPNTPFLLDGRDPTGTWARGMNPTGAMGWVIATSLAATPDQINALPSIWVDTPFTLPPPGAGAVPVQPAAPAQPAPEQVVPQGLPAGGLQVTVGSRVNMRAAPNTRGQIMTTLTAGIPLSVDGRDVSGLWLHGTAATGASGWVSARFVTISALQIVALPVTNAAGVSAPATTPSTSGVAPIAPVVSTAPIRGFSFGGHVDAFSDYAAGKMRQAGMTWAKRQWRYNAGQNPNDVSGIINDAHAKGFHILIGIVGQTWEVNNGGYFDQYAAFVGGVAALGADGIEVWNEMNIDREWPSGSIDPGRYVQLLAGAYNAIKRANPNTLVISGAPSPTGYFGGCSAGGCDDAPYIAGMAAAGAANYADCIGLHYNEGVVGPDQTSGDPRGSSGYYTRYFWGMVNTYSGAFGGRRPLCFTELGYLTPEGYAPLPGGFAWAQNVSLAQQAAWLDRAVSLARSSGKVRLLIIWNVDFTQYGADPMAGYAIIRPNGGCPACDALGS